MGGTAERTEKLVSARPYRTVRPRPRAVSGCVQACGFLRSGGEISGCWTEKVWSGRTCGLAEMLTALSRSITGFPKGLSKMSNEDCEGSPRRRGTETRPRSKGKSLNLTRGSRGAGPGSAVPQATAKSLLPGKKKQVEWGTRQGRFYRPERHIGVVCVYLWEDSKQGFLGFREGKMNRLCLWSGVD